jgi:hypothetical protein
MLWGEQDVGKKRKVVLKEGSHIRQADEAVGGLWVCWVVVKNNLQRGIK